MNVLGDDKDYCITNARSKESVELFHLERGIKCQWIEEVNSIEEYQIDEESLFPLHKWIRKGRQALEAHKAQDTEDKEKTIRRMFNSVILTTRLGIGKRVNLILVFRRFEFPLKRLNQSEKFGIWVRI